MKFTTDEKPKEMMEQIFPYAHDRKREQEKKRVGGGEGGEKRKNRGVKERRAGKE